MRVKIGFAILLLLFSGNQLLAQSISLAGNWQFKTDPKDSGVQAKWFNQQLPERVQLPGSMAENGKGNEVSLKTKWTGSIYDSSFFFNPRLKKYLEPGNLKIPFWLTPAKHYVGVAWYQKQIQLPKDWKNKRWVLSFERAHIETSEQEGFSKRNYAFLRFTDKQLVLVVTNFDREHALATQLKLPDYFLKKFGLTKTSTLTDLLTGKKFQGDVLAHGISINVPTTDTIVLGLTIP